MSQGETEFAEVIRNSLEDHLAEVGVSMPGNVVSYDRAKQTARVRPGLTQRLTSYTDRDDFFYEDLPDMFNVPVVWPGGDGSGTGSSYFHPSLEAGEGVLIVCSDADFSTWLKSGKKANPFDARTHHYAKCVCLPGFRPKGQRLPNSEVVLAAGGVTRSVAVANNLDAMFSAFQTLLLASPLPEVVAVGTALQSARVAAGTNFFSQYIKTGGV